MLLLPRAIVTWKSSLQEQNASQEEQNKKNNKEEQSRAKQIKNFHSTLNFQSYTPLWHCEASQMPETWTSENVAKVQAVPIQDSIYTYL